MMRTLRVAPAALAVLLTGGLAVAGQQQATAPANQPANPGQPPRTPASAPDTDARYQIVAGQVVSSDDAERTREGLRTILRQYPPSLADVLRLDPSLLTNDGYLAPYPQLAAFLKQHPTIAHNPAFFVGTARSEWEQYNSRSGQAMREFSEDFAALLVFSGIMAFLGLIAWGIRNLAEHRRWLRVSKVQSEAHAKIFDRLASSNEDLLAYLQSPAGQRFLESAPLSVEGAHSIGAPVGRILFAAQAGTVVAFLGLGVWYAGGRLAANPNVSDAAPFLMTVSMIIIAVGFGLIVSSGIAYALSRRMGLLGPAASSHA